MWSSVMMSVSVDLSLFQSSLAAHNYKYTYENQILLHSTLTISALLILFIHHLHRNVNELQKTNNIYGPVLETDTVGCLHKIKSI